MANSHCLSFCPCSRRVAVTIPTVTPASPVFSSPRFLPRFLGVAAGSRGGGWALSQGGRFFLQGNIQESPEIAPHLLS